MTGGFHYLHEPGGDAAAPPLLLLHGTGGGEHDLVDLARSLSPGSALLSPRGQVSERGAARFFARIAEGVFDPEEVIRRTDELAAFVTEASARHGIDRSRLLALGFSNGANIAATLMLRAPGTIAGGILLRPMVVLDRPAAPGSIAGVRVLLANGAHDPIVPDDHPPRLARLLSAGGAEVTLHTSDAGHNLTRADIDAARAHLRV